MKKLDKLVLSSFLGPFILTFLVVVFILLTQHMLKYFDDIIGKGLGFDVIGQLLFYFAIFMTPIAMPLAVLLSSLITFGNLGEHFELTAIKSAGISLLRTIQPIFYFVLVLTGIAFYVNNNLVPKAALEAYSLLYDIKQKKPALDLREGSFYNGIPDISIKVNEKFPDGITLKDIIIYDHRKQDGNRDVTIADSGKMYTILNERYLKLELYNGYNYNEGTSTTGDLVGQQAKIGTETLSRSKFYKSQIVFDLSSFQLSRTDKKWFQGNRIMRNLRELDYDLDSLKKEKMTYRIALYNNYHTFYTFFNNIDSISLPAELKAFKRQRDSLNAIERDKNIALAEAQQMAQQVDTVSAATTTAVVTQELQQPATRESTAATDAFSDPRKERSRRKMRTPDSLRTSLRSDSALLVYETLLKRKKVNSDSALQAKLDSVFALPLDKTLYSSAVNKARTVKSQLSGSIGSMDVYDIENRVFRIQWHKILASSLACVAMFLIGAPLGAIIKKGGLGVPFLVSIMFFIIYYLLTMTGEKWAKQGFIEPALGVWAADVILFFVGLIFLRQARVDARLFESDFYQVVFDKVRTWLIERKFIRQPNQ
jgi:lipopolysaccharide export system permease protein